MPTYGLTFLAEALANTLSGTSSSAEIEGPLPCSKSASFSSGTVGSGFFSESSSSSFGTLLKNDPAGLSVIWSGRSDDRDRCIELKGPVIDSEVVRSNAADAAVAKRTKYALTFILIFVSVLRCVDWA